MAGAFAEWRDSANTARDIRDKAGKALMFWSSRFLKISFVGWRSRVVEWKRKKVKVAEALGVCSKAKLRRAFVEWREIAEEAKRERDVGGWAERRMAGYRLCG